MVAGQRGVIVAATVASIALCLCSIQIGRLAWPTVDKPIVLLIWALMYGSVACLGIIWLGYTYVTTQRQVSRSAADLHNRGVFSVVNDKWTTESLIRALSNALIDYIHLNDQLTEEARHFRIQTQRIDRERQLIESVMQSLYDGILVLDEKGKVAFVNRTACRIFGFDRTTIVGQTPGSQLCPDKQAFLEEILTRRSSPDDLYKKEVELYGEEGSHVYHCLMSTCTTPAQQEYGQVIVIRDVTREKEVSHLKSDFVSYVSHELKTPLASITAYAEMLIDKEADNEAMRQSFYDIILSQARRLHRLIDNILNISRIESGLIKVEKSPMSLSVILKEQLQMIQSYAEERHIELVDYQPIVHDQIYADKDMIRQAIVNLLSNAIKYTPPGGAVTVQSEVDEIQGVVRIHITDTGIGIGDEDIDHIFDRFYRGDDSETKIEGSGLGLSLVKKIIEDVHQGRVLVMSRPGMGSTFGFELPLITHHDLQTVYG